MNNTVVSISLQFLEGRKQEGITASIALKVDVMKALSQLESLEEPPEDVEDVVASR